MMEVLLFHKRKKGRSLEFVFVKHVSSGVIVPWHSWVHVPVHV